MEMEFQIISAAVAQAISEDLNKMGIPPTNRVVIATLDDEDQVTRAGIIIPGSTREGVTKRGVQVQAGKITEELSEYNGVLGTGQVIYYGEYAGKEISNLLSQIKSVKVPSKLKLRVLSITEIMYIQNNN